MQVKIETNYGRLIDSTNTYCTNVMPNGYRTHDYDGDEFDINNDAHVEGFAQHVKDKILAAVYREREWDRQTETDHAFLGGEFQENSMIANDEKPVVKLLGEDGNALAIIGKCRKALRNSGADEATIAEFLVDAKSSDYDHLLQVAMKYCDVQ